MTVMPFPFACPECGLETIVDDEFSGHSGPCAGCGKVVTVPFHTLAARTPRPIVNTQSHRRTVVLIVIASIIAASGVFMTLLWLVFPALHGVSSSVQKMSCRANLERIAEALRQYELEHGTLPPAYIADAKGKPMHSWRVLILPQLGETGLHERYKFDEPWDGPNNILLANSMPDVFACPSDPDAKPKGETNYFVLQGPSTLFPGATAMSSRQSRDDPSMTILVVESPVAGTLWLQPKDLDATRMKFAINGAVSGEIGSVHGGDPGGATVVTMDGKAKFLSELFPDDYLEGMSTANGGEDVPLESLQ